MWKEGGAFSGEIPWYGVPKQNMRYIASRSRSDSVDGQYKILSSIGIATESLDYGKSGKLEFNESAFMEGMLKDPSAVKELMNSFAADMKTFAEGMISKSAITVGTTIAKEGSLSNRMDSLERSSNNIDERIENLEARLAMEKASLEILYANMETSLAENDPESRIPLEPHQLRLLQQLLIPLAA